MLTTIKREIAEEVIKEAQVVVSTCIAAADETIREVQFNTVLIDEASQATEPTSLVPISKGCRHLIMVGDPAQLRPTVKGTESTEGGLHYSLFERMQSLGCSPVMLNTQYRMHPSIAEFPSDAFYGGRLLSETERTPNPLGFAWPNDERPVAFVNVEGEEFTTASGTSKGNQQEAEVVVQVRMMLLLVLLLTLLRLCSWCCS